MMELKPEELKEFCDAVEVLVERIPSRPRGNCENFDDYSNRLMNEKRQAKQSVLSHLPAVRDSLNTRPAAVPVEKLRELVEAWLAIAGSGRSANDKSVYPVALEACARELTLLIEEAGK